MNDEAKILGGRYEVGDLIGRGGMAEVHIGYDTRLGRTVAIKILRADLARDPSFQTRFRREAQAAAGLNHPAIVAVYDTGEDHVVTDAGFPQAVPYIVMEYVEGHTVRDILKGDVAAPIDEAVEITAGVLSALDYAHHAGLVHRDIKPANVMLTPTGAVKVMDFGIARALADAGQTMTQTQAVVGTAQYLSPEQARGENVDARSDLYSTGCLLFELLAGRPPFVGDSPVSVAYQHVREEAPRPSQFAADVPPELDQVVLRSLAKNRDERYASAQEFLADLRAVMGGGPVSPSTGAIAVGSAALGAGAAGVAAASFQPDSGEQPTTGATAVMPEAAGTAIMAGAAYQGVSAPPPSVPPTTQPVEGEEELVDEAAERKRRIILYSSIGAAALIAVILLLWLLLKPDAPAEPDVEVPSVAGMTQEEATTVLEDLGLDVTPEEQASADVPIGEAIGTDPEEGEKLFEGDDITLLVSTGPSELAIPDVRGMSEEEATAELEGLGLTISEVDTTAHDPTLEEGRAVGTNPEAGTTVDAGASVTLLIADGQVELPDLTGMTEEEARAALQALDLSSVIKTVESEDEEPGTVVAQSPTAGLVPIGSSVEVSVAEEPSVKEVPNVAGRTEADARSLLEDAGFVVTVTYSESSTVTEGNVISQNPSAGTQVAPGTTVTLVVAKAPAPVTSPTPGPGGGGGGA